MSTLVIWWGPLPRKNASHRTIIDEEKKKKRRDNGSCNQSLVSALSHSREEPLIIFPFKNLRNTSTTKPLSSAVSSILSFHSHHFSSTIPLCSLLSI